MSAESSRVSAERPFYTAHAGVYDLLVTDPVEPWVEFVDNALRAMGFPSAKILDAGCGTGRHAAALAALGHNIELADASAHLLEVATDRCPDARVHQVDLTDFWPGPRFDAVVCRGVLNDTVLDVERQGCLTAFHAALQPGGLAILDLREADASQDRADGSTRRTAVEINDTDRLTFSSTPRWDNGFIRVHETYELTSERGTETAEYDFTMRPWTIEEAIDRFTAAGFISIDIHEGVGRKTADRFIAVANAAPLSQHQE